MTTNSHSHHALYTFLQSHELASHETVETDELNANQIKTEPRCSGNDDVICRHFVSLLTTVRNHSSQLDQMVNYLNSLVGRLESVEAIFSEGQEQVRQMVTQFQTNAANMALQTGDRVNGTLEPALNSFNHSISSLSQQLEAIRTNSEQQAHAHIHHSSSLGLLEKDVHHLCHQVDQLDARLTVDKLENSKRYDNIEKELKSLNSALEPNAVLVPLLQAFLQSQLRSTQSPQEPIGSFEKSNIPCADQRMVDETRSNTRNCSSGVSMRRTSGGGNNFLTGVLNRARTNAVVTKTMEQTDSNQLQSFSGQCRVSDSDTNCNTERQGQTSSHQRLPSRNPTQKNVAEHEPTVTQESTIDGSCGGSNSQTDDFWKGAAQLVESSEHLKRRSIGNKAIDFERLDHRINPIDRTARVDDRVEGDVIRTNTRKRSRSNPITQRKISFKRIQASAIASKNDLESQSIREAEKSSMHHNKPIKKNRRPLLMEDSRDTME